MNREGKVGSILQSILVCNVLRIVMVEPMLPGIVQPGRVSDMWWCLG